MARTQLLNGAASAQPLLIAGYSLLAPGVVGTLTVLRAEESANRSDSGVYEPQLLAALNTHAIEHDAVLELEVRSLAPLRQSAGRSAAVATTREGEPAMVLNVPARADRAYAVLYTDEAGVSRWIVPQPKPTGKASTRGAGTTLAFHLPRTAAPKDANEDGKRGPIAKLGRRVVRVLTWFTDDVVGIAAYSQVHRFETERRTYGFHSLPWRGAQQPLDWTALQAGRALLLIHGTFSSVEGTWSMLPPALLAPLVAAYSGRVFAFNHPSLHQSPDENARALVAMLPENVQLRLDVLAHSRGGLLARELTERSSEHALGKRQLVIERAVFVGVPHRGTILADADHGITMLDRYTNLLAELPDTAVTLILEGILAVVKVLAQGTIKGLPGLQSMFPNGSYQQRINTSPNSTTAYYALAADYLPHDTALLARFGKRVGDVFVDGIFNEANDGVVPTLGSYVGAVGARGFPLREAHYRQFGPNDNIHHNTFFIRAVTHQPLLTWLDGQRREGA